ncbi:hypothetical protein Hamer_G001809 [Homarus americanus]|uniref:Uncharacterized protein n=1 Tax=Homarus americanus TaxID=6706 RepID=A0A8J5JT32_HOMAM|nr:hypothetical protein Hamer_G001809 [Homarus americanus]
MSDSSAVRTFSVMEVVVSCNCFKTGVRTRTPSLTLPGNKFATWEHSHTAETLPSEDGIIEEVTPSEHSKQTTPGCDANKEGPMQQTRLHRKLVLDYDEQ